MGLFSKKEPVKYIRKIHRKDGKDVEVLVPLNKKIRQEEQCIKTSLPNAYRKFLMETEFKDCRKFPFESPYDGIYFYPKAMEKAEEFHQVFGRFYVPSGVDEEGSWVDAENGQIGCLNVFLFGGEGFYSLADCNNGSWTMPCICIGNLNDDLMIVLNCETGKVYCSEHDEVWFEFNSREEYDKGMRLVEKDVLFPDFERFLAWCQGDGIYIPEAAE